MLRKHDLYVFMEVLKKCVANCEVKHAKGRSERRSRERRRWTKWSGLERPPATPAQRPASRSWALLLRHQREPQGSGFAATAARSVVAEPCGMFFSQEAEKERSSLWPKG